MKYKLSTRPNHCPAWSDSLSQLGPGSSEFLLSQGTFCHRHQILVCWLCCCKSINKRFTPPIKGKHENNQVDGPPDNTPVAAARGGG